MPNFVTAAYEPGWGRRLKTRRKGLIALRAKAAHKDMPGEA